jgi:Zn-dependent alcohol dehydrogenase
VARPSWSGRFPVFLDWYQAGRLDLAALVTSRYSLDRLVNGVNDLRQGKVAGRAVVLL